MRAQRLLYADPEQRRVCDGETPEHRDASFDEVSGWVLGCRQPVYITSPACPTVTSGRRCPAAAHPERGFTGRDQVRRNWEQIFAAVPDVTAEVVRIAVDGDTA